MWITQRKTSHELEYLLELEGDLVRVIGVTSTPQHLSKYVELLERLRERIAELNNRPSSKENRGRL